MNAADIKTLVRKQPFEPVEIGLSDGRAVLIQHPDQVVIARRHVIFGLAQQRSRRQNASTPADGDAVAKDWLLVDLVHVVSAESVNGDSENGKRRKRRPKDTD